MSDPKLTLRCEGGCGEERDLSKQEIEHLRFYTFHWWCDSCEGTDKGAGVLLTIITALTRQPHLRAKLREILEMEAKP